MKNTLVITVAGTSSRFTQSLQKETLKCIYSESPYNKTILEVLLGYADKMFDKIIIVGGYKFDDLIKYVANYFDTGNISLINNDLFADYGSNYSLYLGIAEALKDDDCSITFVEGDLIFDRQSFEMICTSKYCVVTSNSEPIRADKSVVFYQTKHNAIKYIYDTKHKELFIPEPFIHAANSGQIWKFTQPEILRLIIQSQNKNDYKDTNLNIIQKYFGQQNNVVYNIINIKQWYNCNTVEDYRRAFQNIDRSTL
jgi:choline kinase